jgi:hypothetical protein
MKDEMKVLIGYGNSEFQSCSYCAIRAMDHPLVKGLNVLSHIYKIECTRTILELRAYKMNSHHHIRCGCKCVFHGVWLIAKEAPEKVAVVG